MSGRLTPDERTVARYIAAMTLQRDGLRVSLAQTADAMVRVWPSRMDRVRAVGERYARLLAATEARR